MIAAVLRELMAAGIEGEALIAAIARIEAETPSAKDEQAERRRAKDRQRKRLRNSAESAELVSPEGFPTPLPKPLPKTPLKGVKRVSDPTDFDQFWTAYPHRVQRRTAETAFRRALRRANLPIILAGIDNAKRFSRKWRDGFLQNPATWLNADGWLDEHGHPSLAFSTTDPPPVLSASQIARFADHYRQTGEWKPALGQIPEEIAA